MHTHFPRLPGLALPIEFFSAVCLYSFAFLCKVSLEGASITAVNILRKPLITFGVLQSESATHMSCFPGAMLLIAHTGQSRDPGPEAQPRPLRQDGYISELNYSKYFSTFLSLVKWSWFWALWMHSNKMLHDSSWCSQDYIKRDLLNLKCRFFSLLLVESEAWDYWCCSLSLWFLPVARYSTDSHKRTTTASVTGS